MRITIQITLAAVILIAGIFIGRMTVNKEKVTDTETKLTDSTELLPAFKETKIGDQIWMVENLNVDTFRDGTKIPEAKTNEEWEKLGQQGQPAWCYYDNDPKNGKKYGKLYNWYAVIDPRGLAPDGYHIPSDEDWDVLEYKMGGEYVSGIKLKSKSGWADNNGESGNGSDDFGFCALPGGFRYDDGPLGDLESFNNIGYYGYWWSSTELSEGPAWGRLGFDYSNPLLKLNFYYQKENGLSVRCIKDSEPEK